MNTNNKEIWDKIFAEQPSISNEVMCEDCLTDFIKNMSHYHDYDSLRYEINHFNIIAQKLGMSEKAAQTPDGKLIIIT